MNVARMLEVQYAWVDSLCIIQDDGDDWQREASKMAEIYANSYLTVAASSSSNSLGGCFASWSTTRSVCDHFSSETVSLGIGISKLLAPILDTQNDKPDPWLLSRTPYASITTLTENVRTRVYLHLEWLPSSMKKNPTSVFIGTLARVVDPVAEEPLNTRGWTLQERILSPRKLHCGAEQLFWQCCADLKAEDESEFVNHTTTLNTIISCQ